MTATSKTGRRDVSANPVPGVAATRKSPCSHQAVKAISAWATVLRATAAWEILALGGKHATLRTPYGSAARHLLDKVVLLVADGVLLAHLWGWLISRDEHRLGWQAVAGVTQRFSLALIVSEPALGKYVPLTTRAPSLSQLKAGAR
jgi:hypothetical protein